MRGRVTRGATVARAVSAALLLGGLGALSSACGLSTDASDAISAPLVALKDSDTVVEQNLQTAQTAVQTGAQENEAGTGIATTSGPSTGYQTISLSGGSLSGGTGQPVVLAGFNQLSNDCLGLVEITTPGATVLGESQPGTYYFWIARTTYTACDAAGFAATAAVPKGWPSGDPSASPWPVP